MCGACIFRWDSILGAVPVEKSHDTKGQTRYVTFHGETRRQFLRQTAWSGPPHWLFVAAVHAAEDNTIRLVFIGCGGRGSAVGNAMNSSARVKLSLRPTSSKADSSMAAHASLQGVRRPGGCPQGSAVRRSLTPAKKAIDRRPGDVAMLTSFGVRPPAAAEYAVEQGQERVRGEVLRPDAPALRRLIRRRRGGRQEERQDRRWPARRHSVNRQER